MLRTLACRAARSRGLAARGKSVFSTMAIDSEASAKQTVTSAVRAFTTSQAGRNVAVPSEKYSVNYHNDPPEEGYAFFMPRQSLIGPGSMKAAAGVIKKLELKKALIVTDAHMAKSGATKAVTDVLQSVGVESVIFDGAMPNPTDINVADGLSLLRSEGCDFVISFGGGSSHDCAKGISVVATNGGRIHDYEGVDQSKVPMLPLVSVNTTAGTASR